MTMGTTGGTNLTEKQRDKLNDLIQLDYDAVEAYAAAIERLDEPASKARLTEFMGDHERHISELSALVSASGGKPETKGDMKRFLTKGKVVIGNILGDKGVMKAMRANETVTNEAYEAALKDEKLVANAHVRQLLTRNLEDERRHKAWFDAQIDRMD